MKWIIILLALLLTTAALIYGVLFTPPGNALVKPLLESRLQTSLSAPVRLTRFMLKPDRFEITLLLTTGNQIEADGSFSLLRQTVDARYRADLYELASLEPLTKLPLRGKFDTTGSITGDMKKLTIEGTSDLAGSATTYRAILQELEPASVTATIRHAQLDKLLYIINENALAFGSINADIDLKNLDPASLQGKADMTLVKGRLNRALLQKQLNIELPDSALEASLHAGLDGKTVIFDSKLDSLIAHLDASGRLIPQNSGMDVKYALDIKELGVLQSITGHPLRGPFAMKGTLKGDNNRLDAVAGSNLAGGSMQLQAVLKAFKPASAVVNAKHLRLKALLQMLGEPLYADGDMTLSAQLPDLTQGHMKGKIALSIDGGSADREVVSKAFGWKHFNGTAFTVKSMTTLAGDQAESTLDVGSDLLALHAAPVNYTLSKRLLTADFSVDIPDLDRLYFLTERPMRGPLKATGNLRFDQMLTLHADSRVAGGNVKATLNDTVLHADLNALKTQPLLHMLTYPEVFDGTLDGTLDYDTADKKGVMKAQLSKGYFTRNTAFDLLRQYSTVDMYKESFKGDSEARIDDKLIDADLTLQSNRTSLSSKHAKIDTQANTIDAKVHVEAEKTPIDFRLKGSLDKPGVSVDAGKLIEQEAGKQINRLLNNLFK